MDKYELAQDRIAGGLWMVDAEAGMVFGRKGARLGSRTFSGYTFLTMVCPDRGRGYNVNVYAHRVIWESVHGPIPVGLQINHINGDKRDNRLANLEAVTPSENQRHAFATGLHEVIRGEDHVNAKVTRELAASIRSRAAAGETQRVIAASVGVSRQHVGRIVRGERWSEVA